VRYSKKLSLFRNHQFHDQKVHRNYCYLIINNSFDSSTLLKKNVGNVYVLELAAKLFWGRCESRNRNLLYVETKSKIESRKSKLVSTYGETFRLSHSFEIP